MTTAPVQPLRRGVIERYRAFLPVSDSTPVITLLEGDTPLIPSRYLSDLLKIKSDIYFKYEGLNPTGSFKDRGMTLAVSKAVERGARAVLCASTGNTSASAAAYAARAGMTCAVLIPEGRIALGKLAQALMHGARVIAIQGNFDKALTLAREISKTHPIVLVNSVNPDRLEGQKTAAFEIIETLGEAPDIHCLPVGNAGNITAYWMGYREFHAKGRSRRLPKMWGFQASGAAPIVRGHPVEHPETIATAIRIGNPASLQGALAARDESKGLIDEVTDDDILEAYRFLAAREGIFCEPASAASVAGLIKTAQKGMLKAGQTIVCTLTGHGLKDPDTATKVHQLPVPVIPEMDTVLKAMGF
ncbi:MAG: threonine synthase [Elusimicrobiota bacterium]|jgi:threonine synthase